MTESNLRTLHVFIANNLAGSLALDGFGQLSFKYGADYQGPDLSIQFPTSQEVYRGKHVQAWFDNLLPDDNMIRLGMAREASISTGVFSLLEQFGLDLPGAVQVVTPGSITSLANTESRYARLSSQQIEERLNSILEADRNNQPCAWATSQEHWSLGGMQTKLALREFNNEWFECLGAAASNVIIKPGVASLQKQALTECITMRLAKYCQLPVAEVRAITFGELPAIVIDRYDRFTLSNTGEVLRIHQEDLCQTTGTISSKKYAADGGPSTPELMSILEKAEGSSQNRFIDALFFNYLTASTDAHAKNYSLLHPSGSRYLLAPLYDLASVAPYMEKGRTYRTGMSIGGENRIGWLRQSSLKRFAALNKLDYAALVERVNQLAEDIKLNLEKASHDFEDFDGIDELASRLIPRITALCNMTQRNIAASSKSFKPIDIARWTS